MILINGSTLTVHYEGEQYTKQITPEENTQVKVYALDADYESIIDLCFKTSKKLLKRDGFWEENGAVYYKNIGVSIPEILAEKLIKSDDQEFDRLIKFWGWLSLNPNPRTRENLYGWVATNGVQLTEGGEMILYRRAYRVKDPVQEFVEQTYERLKGQKKSTNVTVYKDQDGQLKTCSRFVDFAIVPRGQKLGNLKEMYNNPVEQDVFTDAHTRQERYVLGEEAWMKRDQGDESNVCCSRGYHAASITYNFSGFGDTPLAVVINPMYVFNSVDGHTKIRTARFTPVAVLKQDCEWINDPEVHERIKGCYTSQVENLEKLLAETDFEDYKTHEILKNQWNLQVGFEKVLNILNN